MHAIEAKASNPVEGLLPGVQYFEQYLGIGLFQYAADAERVDLLVLNQKNFEFAQQETPPCEWDILLRLDEPRTSALALC